MAAFVVDVNVAIVANDGSPQADNECQLSCLQALREVREGIICLDDRDYILGEYRKHLDMSGQPGVGDEFMYWVHQNQYTSNVCERVRITKHSARRFEEFPNDPQLSDFDPSDRKYAAVALASNQKPEILNAVDADWRDFETQFHQHGLTIRQLCPNCLRKSE